MNISGIMMDSVVDGKGVRMAIFFQGCPHHCKGCQNPDTWDYDKKCIQMSVKEVLELFDKDSILAGITLSGGEPFSPCNFDEIAELCREIKARNKTVWAFTGYTVEGLISKFPEIKDTILLNIDVIVDGPFILEERDLLCKFRGSKNQRLVDVKKYLSGEKNFLLE